MNLDNVAKRLEERFGLGDQPGVRKKLYARLERAVEEYGELAYGAIARAVGDAPHMRCPDRWFCATIVARLRALDCWPQERVVDF